MNQTLENFYNNLQYVTGIKQNQSSLFSAITFLLNAEKDNEKVTEMLSQVIDQYVSVVDTGKFKIGFNSQSQIIVDLTAVPEDVGTTIIERAIKCQEKLNAQNVKKEDIINTLKNEDIIIQ